MMFYSKYEQKTSTQYAISLSEHHRLKCVHGRRKEVQGALAPLEFEI